MMVATPAAQRTPGWMAERCGKVTASRLGDLVARTKTGYSASRASYMTQLLAERLSGSAAPTPLSGPMRWGVEYEAEAKAAYSFVLDFDVAECGFVDHPTIGLAGASPDGLIGEEGLVEIKCPTSVTHVETWGEGRAPAKHLPQIQWQLACTGRLWCDFVSYDPRMPPNLRLFIVRVMRDPEEIARLEEEVVRFLAELDQKLLALTGAPDLLEAAA
jgi:putative phage-type endonuclease